MTQSTPPSQTNATTTPHDQFDGEEVELHAPQLYAYGEVAEPVVGLDAIDDAAFERYQQDGFLAIEGAFSEAQVEAARRGIHDLILGRIAGEYDVQFEAGARDRLGQLTAEQREAAVRKLMKFGEVEPGVAAMAKDPTLLGVLRKLLGNREPRRFQDMALLKPPHGREKPWHQDKAYFNIRPDEPVVGVWIALDEATPENGCMHVVPGSHRHGPVVHFRRRDWQICDTEMAGKPITAVPLKPGGLMLFDGLLQHGTPYNPTDQRRRALQYHYCPADAEWTDQESRLAVFGSEGKDVEC
jgi:phytanoyl-CoA hydroxylase